MMVEGVARAIDPKAWAVKDTFRDSLGYRVHNWRNYISEEVQAMWATFTAEQKRALARQADAQASAEEWD